MGHDFLNDPILSGAFRYWRRQRGSRAMPPRRAIDPIEIPRLLPNLQLIDVVEGGRFRYRLTGTGLVTAFGKEYTGKHLDELFAGDELAYAVRVYSTVCSERRPVFLRNRYGTTRDVAMVANRLYMPLSDDGVSVNVIFGALTFEWGRGVTAGSWTGAPLDPTTATIAIVDEPEAEPAVAPA